MNEHVECIGTFVRYGSKYGDDERQLTTILLTNIRTTNGNIPISDHMWFDRSEAFDRLQLERGDRVILTGQVVSYWKSFMGFKGCQLDYRLINPINLKKINRSPNYIPHLREDREDHSVSWNQKSNHKRR